ncbi:pentatricopeptide repeat-containing protein DOT4, chloroplastic [Selaginella moellendorffii]|uniref:pentatricopeptide repeat-containing protein DOT4, chloroplastic n=1 Tax=Selaginella moellendorffii TaxID=88036 RepID=UPI000D1D0EA9|nr:pentatricopeptide repeat-containing protein DOT4, chloroplastic [Selaginella moellendorffii]|eukprot:XP_024535887.1 pentatricopeptide repeat-containing protein DOT4, chloroplastic [Selaginella moellendorffii]
MEAGFISHGFVRTSLVNSFGRSGKLAEARRIFDEHCDEKDIFLWNTMLGVYADHGEAEEDGVFLFWRLHLEGLKADRITLTTMASACDSPELLRGSTRIHDHCVELGYMTDVVTSNSIITMDASCGNWEEAVAIFRKSQHRDVVTWSAVIAGYFKQGRHSPGIRFFQEMVLEGLKPSKVTLVAMLGASGLLLEEAKKIHAGVVAIGSENDSTIGNAMVRLYGRCGSTLDANKAFDKLGDKSVVSWSVMISALSQHGNIDQVHRLLHQMQQEGLKPNQHLLGRAGWLAKAEALMVGMPFPPTLVMLKSLLGACGTYGNLERGQRLAQEITCSVFMFPSHHGSIPGDGWNAFEGRSGQDYGPSPERHIEGSQRKGWAQIQDTRAEARILKGGRHVYLKIVHRDDDVAQRRFARDVAAAKLENGILELQGAPSAVWIHPNYVLLEELIERELEQARWHCFHVVGTPGIGKSYFALYWLYKLARRKTRVIHCLDRDDHRHGGDGDDDGDRDKWFLYDFSLEDPLVWTGPRY